MRQKTSFTTGRSAKDWDSMVDDDFSTRRMLRKHLTREQFGERLFNLSVEHGWSQAETARQAGLSRNAISNYMRGNYLPDAVSLKKLADAFDMKPEDLLPNVVEAEVKMSRNDPVLEIKAAADPSSSWVKINRLIKTSHLPKLLALLEEASATASDD